MQIISKLQEELYADIKVMDQLIIESINISQLPLIKQVAKHLIKSGGKRIRPILTLLVAKLFNYSGDQHFKLAAAIEFIHAATLLHDDVIDKSQVRRSKPSANTIWGNKVSILVGDYLFSQSFQLMVSAGSMVALDDLSKASTVIAKGEIMQLNHISNIAITEKDYMQAIGDKTAKLFASACAVSGIITNQSTEIIAALKSFGLLLGIIFQISDDVMDYYSEELGKNIGDDFREGKLTLPSILAYEAASPEHKNFIVKTLGELDQKPEDFFAIKKIFNKYQVLDKIHNRIKDLQQQAYQEFCKLPQNNIYCDYMLELLAFASNRAFNNIKLVA